MQANARSPWSALCPSASRASWAAVDGLGAFPHPGAALFGVALIAFCLARTHRLAIPWPQHNRSLKPIGEFVSCTLQGIRPNRNVSVVFGYALGDLFLLFRACRRLYNHRQVRSQVLVLRF